MRHRLHVPSLAALALLSAAPGCARSEADVDSWDSTAMAAGPAGGATCVRDSTTRHDDPVALVDEWVRREAEGPFEQAELHAAWIAGATTCAVQPGLAPVRTVSGVRTRAGRLTSDSAVVVVEGLVGGLATARDGPRQAPVASATLVDTALAVRTPHGWRIARLPRAAFRQPDRAR